MLVAVPGMTHIPISLWGFGSSGFSSLILFIFPGVYQGKAPLELILSFQVR